MKKFLLCLLSTAAVFSCAVAGPIVLKNDLVEFQFAEKSGVLLRIKNLGTGRNITFRNPANIWSLLLVDGTRRVATVDKGEIVSWNNRRNNGVQTLTIVWQSKVSNSDSCRVTMTVKLADGESIGDWHISAESRGNPALWIKEMQFPRFSSIESLGDDAFYFGRHLGRMIRNPGKNAMQVRSMFPGELSMQLAAFCGSAQAKSFDAGGDVSGYIRGAADDETGLFTAIDDAKHYIKEFAVNRNSGNTFDFYFTNYPSYPFWPANSQVRSKSFKYDLPYTFKIGSFSGGVGKVAELYRKIIGNRAELAGGKLFSPGNPTSSKVLDSVFWGKIYWGANKVVPEMLRMQEYLQVPSGVHWVRFSVSPFDDNNLDYMPTTAHFREGVRTLRDVGIGVAPYVCCGVWDRDTESFKRFGIEKAVVKDEFGKSVDWILHHQVSHWMNPASPVWRKQYHDLTAKLFGQLDTDGQYLDVFAGGSHLAFNSDLHPVNGGNYWVANNHKMLDAMRRTNRTIQDAPFLLTECFAESYVGRADAFLMLDMTRYGWCYFKNKEVFPLSSLIYHDYAVFYGSDCAQTQKPDSFRWNMGLSFIWGIQLCYSSYKIGEPGKTAHDRYTRELAHAWHQVGRKFLTGGKGIETALVADASQAGNAAVAAISSPTRVELKNSMGGKFFWRGPSVPVSTWEALDGTVGITITNISDKDQQVKLLIDPARLNCKYNTLWQSWPLPARKITRLNGKREFSFKVPVDRCMILEIRSDSAPQVTPLIENKTLAMTADAKGNFPERSCEAGKLYGSDRFFALHRNGKIAMVDAQRKPLRATMRNWRYVEGYGGSRSDDNRTFYLLKDSGCTLSHYRSALIQLDAGVMSGEVELEQNAEFTGPDGAVLIASGNGEILCGVGKLALPAGLYRIAAYQSKNSELLPGNNISALAGISRKAADLAVKTLSGKDILNSARRIEGIKFAAIGNAISFVVTGKRAELSNNQEWLMPGRTVTLSYKADSKGKLTLLNCEHVKSTQIRALGNNRFTVKPGKIESAANIFRLFFSTVVGSEHGEFTVTSLNFVEVAEPLVAEIPPELEEYVKLAADDVINTSVYIRNTSPVALPVTITPEIPANWELSPRENKLKFTIKGNSRYIAKLRFRRRSSGDDTGKFVIKVNYCNEKYAAVSEEFVIINRKVAVAPAGKGNSKIRWSNVLRSSITLAVAGSGGKTIKIGLRPHHLSNTNRTTSAKLTLFDSNMQQIRSETVRFNNSDAKFVNIKLPAGEAAFVKISSRFFKIAVEGAPHYGLSVWNNDPINLFCHRQKFYFVINAGAKHFEFIGEDGGPTEIARVILRDPAGKIVFNRKGRFSKDDPVKIPVKSGHDGKVWSMEVVPVQDFYIRLGAGASDWVSFDKDTVLRTK